jgi:hypothetical protein
MHAVIDMTMLQIDIRMTRSMIRWSTIVCALVEWSSTSSVGFPWCVTGTHRMRLMTRSTETQKRL